MAAYRPVLDGCKLKQNVIAGCNSCANLAGLVLCFIACFILLVIAPFVVSFCGQLSLFGQRAADGAGQCCLAT